MAPSLKVVLLQARAQLRRLLCGPKLLVADLTCLTFWLALVEEGKTHTYSQCSKQYTLYWETYHCEYDGDREADNETEKVEASWKC